MTMWLHSLKDIAYDIDDVLDELDYEDLQSEVENDGRSLAYIGPDISLYGPPEARELFSFLKAGVLRRRISNIGNRFEEVIEDKEKALDMELGGEETGIESVDREVRGINSSISDEEMLGRDKEKDEVMKFLLGSPRDLSVLAIVGMGGLGKTMLALSVYNDGEMETYFEQKIWVHVSFDFDVERIMKQIIQQVADPLLASQLLQIDNFDILQVNLAKILKGKRFLLVLDDLWYEDGVISNLTSWERLCAPLLLGGKGSKILVTTRRTQLAGVVHTVEMVKLEALKFEDSWTLFKRRAFPDGNSGKYPNLEVIGKEIVMKLDGVPLAVIAIGSLLRSKSEESEWTDVLESELWELEQGEDGIFPALRLSYEHLPPPLKPCFAYFSVFPKGRQFHKLELVQLWMASGYISSHGRKRMEDVGSDYLSCLLSRSLIQSVDHDKYTVHDLLHDLSRSILHYDCCTVETNNLHQIPAGEQPQHHVSVRVSERLVLSELEKLQDFRRSRTCCFSFSNWGIFPIPGGLFVNLTCLRVLDLSGGGIHNLPDSIGKLKHLRYLDLSRTRIGDLPESMCCLYMLQTLRLRGCVQLGALPTGMSNLVGLRHLEAGNELVSRVSGIGRLVHLQELDVFSIPEGDGIRIEDLKDMNELRGRLCIQNLQRVGSEEEASRANLRRKEYVKKLVLEWAEHWDVNRENTELTETVLEALSPPPNLKDLTINFYDGDKIPSWMNQYQSMSGLESLSLSGCRWWDALPPLLERLPYLKTLEISRFPLLEELPATLPTTITNLRLQGVRLNCVPALQTLSSLQALILLDIPDLRDLPPLPTTLRIITMVNLGLEALPEFRRGLPGDGADDSTSPLLNQLSISGCQNLRSLCGALRHRLPDLAVLSIQNCGELECWPEGEGFQATMRSLREELIIQNCPKLKALPEGIVISSSLKKLVVEGCPGFPDRQFFIQLQDMKDLTREGYVSVQKQYWDLASFAEEALQQMSAVDCLMIFVVDDDNGAREIPFLSLDYDLIPVGLPKNANLVPLRRLALSIRRGSSNSDEDRRCWSTLSTCLRHNQLCSSLFCMLLVGMPYGTASLLPREEEEEEEQVSFSSTSQLPSLWELEIMGPRDTERLPVETLLCHLTQLRQLGIFQCSELTLPSLEQAIRSLPSLERLVIRGCPKLSLPIAGAPARLSHPSSSPPLPQLRCLLTDDVGLLANRQFVHDHLASLDDLAIWASSDASFSVTEEVAWPRTVKSLSFRNCYNPSDIPPDFFSLFPALEALFVSDCPGLGRALQGDLPPSLEMLDIEGVPGLVLYRHKVAHIRLITMDGTIVQGSYSGYRDLVAKGRTVLVPFSTSEFRSPRVPLQSPASTGRPTE